jgi:hypothetical protein
VAVNERHGLVITNWHVINEATGQVTVEFPDGFESPATIQKVDRDWDLAALAIWRPQVAPVPVAREAPRPGEVLTIAGYGPGKYRAVSGQCTQYVAPGERFPYEMVELAATARQGDSGGPILNSRGELAGVLFGEGQGRTAGSYCGRVQWFLDSVIGHPVVESAANSMIAQTPFDRQPARSPLAKFPSETNLASDWPPRSETLPVQSPSGELASAAHSWRSTADFGYQGPVRPADVAMAARPEADRPLQVASVTRAGAGKGAAEPIAESVAPPAGVADVQAAVSPSESQVSTDRWEQIKAFCGVVAAIGLLLLVIRSLAAAGVEPDGKQKAAK